MIRILIAAVVLTVCGGTTVCASAPVPETVKSKQFTRTYDLKPILGSKSATTKMVDASAVVRLILETVKVGELKPGSPGPQLVLRNGNTLEVTAGEKVHGEIKDLLDALERLADLAIDIETKVIELTPKDADGLIIALPKPEKGRPQLPILFGHATGAERESPDGTGLPVEANKRLKSGKVIQTSAARFANGVETTLSSRHAIGTYHPTLDAAKKPTAPLQHFQEGFALRAFPLVSADRRFVRFKLIEQSTISHGLKTREVRGFGDQPELEGLRVAPDLSDVGATGSATLADGGTAIFKLAYAPKDKVWVVVLKATIFIQVEEDELKKEKK